ncbi:MAG: hypothetical protein HZB56_02085 [Deltaproteobacteria bacterium]|nr:hypothetical protein [Deltaproteobacteria bacterium]
MKRFLLAVPLLAAALLALAGPAQAQAPSPYPQPPPPPPGTYPPPPPPGAYPPPGYYPPQGYAPPADPTFHRHLGFFLQLDLGIGGQKATWTDTFDGAQKLSGDGGTFSVAVGGALVENLILAGHLWAFAAPEPDYTIAGQRVSTAGREITLGLSGIGLNVTYYVMPANVYLSVTPSAATASLQQSGTSQRSERGFGLRAAIGKEWWVGSHWGVGLNVQAAFARNGNGPSSGRIQSSAVAVAFSATYN